MATGYWKGITASETLEYEVHVGFSQENGTNSEKEEAKTLSNALDAGLKVSLGYEGEAHLGITKSTVKAEMKTEIKKTTENEDEKRAMDAVSSMSGKEQNQNYKTTCSPKEIDEGRAGLWQWVIATEDKSAMAFTDHTICRTGSLWNTPPACNYWDCKNASCSECMSTV